MYDGSDTALSSNPGAIISVAHLYGKSCLQHMEHASVFKTYTNSQHHEDPATVVKYIFASSTLSLKTELKKRYGSPRQHAN